MTNPPAAPRSVAPPPDEIDTDRPWVRLVALAEARDADALAAFVDALGSNETARSMAHLPADDQRLVMEALGAEEAAELLEQLSRAQTVEIVEHLTAEYAADVLAELPEEFEADILRDLEDEDADSILAELPPDEAADARALWMYDDDTAGGLMTTQFASVRASFTVSEVVEHLRATADTYLDFHVQYVYVLDDDDHLCGVLRLRDLLLAQPHQGARELMIDDPVSVEANTPLDDLVELFDKASFIGVPVVDHGTLVGVVRRSAVLEEVGEEAYRDQLKAAGIAGGEELRAMRLVVRARRRLGWLSINIGLNVVAASVIAAYQDTLAAVIALAVFLPIISDMSGCSGNQAVAVSMRELSLGVARPRDVLYVWGKELSVGVVNGAVLGLLLGAVAFAWQGNVWLGVVAGVALAVNTVIAVSIGGTVPLILKGFGVDPALASGPVLTTITDLCGFLLVLGLATAMLPWLV